MKCDICNENDAVIFLKEVRGSQTKELHLCLDCARKKGLTPSREEFDPEKISLEKIISAMSEKRSCKICGRSLDDIKRYKSVGCPACYQNFKTELKEMINEGNEPVSYCCSYPKHLSEGRTYLEDRAFLQEKLAESVAKEDFENAAIYRDKIKELDRKDE